MAQILIVSENDSDADQLKTVFRKAGLTAEIANSITTGCELAKSGRYKVVFSTHLALTMKGHWKWTSVKMRLMKLGEQAANEQPREAHEAQ